MIFEEIIDNEYRIITYSKEIDKSDRENIKKFLKKKKILEIDKEIFLHLNTEKINDIQNKISIIDENIKKIKGKYDEIFIENLL